MGKMQLFHFIKVETYFSLTAGSVTTVEPSCKSFILKLLNASSSTYAACMTFELFSFKKTIFFNQSKVYLL